MALSRREVMRGVTGTAVLIAQAARAQAAYPSRTVKLIVPYPAGGTTDLLGRLVADQIKTGLNATVIVENKPGAATTLGAELVARAEPDGYTLLIATSTTLAINKTLYKKLPYDPAKDLALVALIASVPFVLVVSPSLPVTSVDDLIKLAKQRPLSYGSGGIGAFHHLAGSLFANMAGIKMTHVPYRGTAPALNDLLGGYIQLMFSDLGPALPLITAGKLRALAVTNRDRFTALPDVPPLGDAGVPGYNIAAWQGVIAPGKTSKDVLNKLNASFNAVVALDDVKARMKDLGMIPIGKGDPDELKRFLDAEIVRWSKVVEAAGLAHTE